MIKELLKKGIENLKKAQAVLKTIARAERRDRAYLKISTLSGKLTGIPSLTTTCKCNPYCLARSKDKRTICSSCYAMHPWKNCEKAWKSNFSKLQEIIPWEKLPLTNNLWFRFESHGDVASVNQAINYLNIALKNRKTKFVLWTKNYSIVKEAIEKNGGKPANFKLIISSPLVNYRLDLNRYPYADKCFTVYTEAYAVENKISINCGGQDCLGCMLCYWDNNIDYINELKK